MEYTGGLPIPQTTGPRQVQNVLSQSNVLLGFLKNIKRSRRSRLAYPLDANELDQYPLVISHKHDEAWTIAPLVDT